MHFEVSSEIEDNIRDPLELLRNKGNETLVVNNDIAHEIAPGERKQVESLINSNFEYLSFPHRLSNGTFRIV